MSPTGDFSRRLRLCAVRGRLTKSDLMRWFKRPYHTVAHWYVDGNVPWGPNGDEARRRLAVLEAAIKTGRHFPVPFDLTPAGRIDYLKRVQHDLRDRFSKPRAAE